MFKKTALVAAVGLALSAAAQADYRWELGASYAHGTADSELKNTSMNEKNSNDADIGSVEGTFYLKDVDTSKGPLGEAAFLDHASNITVAFSDGEVDLTSTGNEDGQTYSVQSRYVAEGPDWQLSGWLIDLGMERQEPGDAEIDLYNIGLGKYITPNTTVVLGYQKLNINNGGDTDRYGVALDHFFAFEKGGLKAQLNAGKTVVSGLDDPTTWGVGATWYLNNNWGIGANFEQTDYSGYEVNGFGVNAEWFITESFAVELSYSDVQPDDIKIPTGGKLETSYDEVAISALYRF
jgi:Putative general bacterial porin